MKTVLLALFLFMGCSQYETPLDKDLNRAYYKFGKNMMLKAYLSRNIKGMTVSQIHSLADSIARTTEVGKELLNE